MVTNMKRAKRDTKLEAMLLCRDIWVGILKKFNNGYLKEERVYNLSTIHDIKAGIVEDIKYETKKQHPSVRYIKYPSIRNRDMHFFNYCPACLECMQECVHCFMMRTWMGPHGCYANIPRITCETGRNSPYRKIRLCLNSHESYNTGGNMKIRSLSEEDQKSIIVATRAIVRGTIFAIKRYKEKKSENS
jgi:hypothetical protein